MAKSQPIYKESFVDELLSELHSGNVERYLAAEPDFGKTNEDICYLNNFEVKTYKLHAMTGDDEHDLESAIYLYEAFPNLTPLLAAYGPFWTYFSHTYLYKYLQKRFPKVHSYLTEGRTDDAINYIEKYWFFSGATTSWLPAMWWSVYLTVDKDRLDPYELTRVLYRQQDLRTRTLGTYLIFRHKPAALAILEYIKLHENDVLKNYFQDKTRFIMKSLNYAGGTQQLAYRDQSFFTEFLEGMNDELIEKFGG